MAHTGIIQFPMRKAWKRVHRLVVLPDYQGIGIGVKFINEISKHYIDNGFNMNLTTTTPALVGALAKDKKWCLVRADRVKNTLQKNLSAYYADTKPRDDNGLGKSSNRITYSFVFKK